MRLSTLFTMMTALTAFQGTAQATDIEFWYGNTGSGEAAIQAACKGFNESQTKDHITCTGQGSYEAGMQKAIAAYRSKNHPVLIQFFDAGTLDLMLSGAVIPVSEAMPDVKWDEYIAGARAYYETAEGKLYSQPYNSSTLLFYTNRTMLEKAGVTKTPETWEEVIEAARKLKAAGAACPFTTDVNPWRQLEQFAARHGVPIASKHNGYDGLDAEYVFNQGIIKQHLNNLKNWRDEGLVRLNADTKAGDYTAAFNAGECAMMEGSSGSYATSLKAFGDKYQITVSMAPMYAGHERHNTLVGGASLWLMKGHSEAEVAAAQAFLDYLRMPEQQIAFTEMTGYLPVTQAAIDKLEKDGLADNPKFGTARIGMQSLSMPATPDTRGVRLGFYVQFREIFNEETQKAYAGEISMDAALDNAKRRGDELLSRFKATYASAAAN
ncbi:MULTISPECIES: extracellular solute-binding protein [unclassified Sinorhizobium]|uniref:extracellular solute-binding protein n=1 Tax=unclassified Sinorhizobium TaxID=2613772 RepID=UPI0035257E70